MILEDESLRRRRIRGLVIVIAPGAALLAVYFVRWIF